MQDIINTTLAPLLHIIVIFAIAKNGFLFNASIPNIDKVHMVDVDDGLEVLLVALTNELGIVALLEDVRDELGLVVPLAALANELGLVVLLEDVRNELSLGMPLTPLAIGIGRRDIGQDLMI